MAKKKPNKKKFRQKLIHKYRMVVINEDTFEEKISFKLSRLNVFIFGGLFTILLIGLTTILIAFTPLREYIPGYSSAKLRKDANYLLTKVDSLEREIAGNEVYFSEIKNVLKGNVSGFEFDKDSVIETFKFDIDSLPINASETDSLFRTEIERADKFSFFEEAKKDAGIVFFAPITGTITSDYNINQKHYAIDIAVKTGTPVKAVADGTVIFAEWTAQTGHVIILEHAKGFISIYKHNGALHKQQGDLVKSGEVIASSGSTGEFSTGPHLHFELWNDGYPVDPINFIDFE
ncbi:M23 family metallopeptidase [Urechidicola croceus]|uniref:Peptidase M23 n=1 Tax=Urechidicola croceus TaxID=1850246 RepID=A0A1D8P9U7_9FLAO|nr:M23 family metallopeptidase [Urechidicola croceus]AOW21379.1 peptidase M23 [Urechidicola croceus]